MSQQQDYSTLDPVAKLNIEAEVNLSRDHLMAKDISFYSEYDYIPIQEDRAQKIQQALNNWHQILKPTISNLKKANVEEIQDRIYRKAKPWEGEINSCIFNAKTVKDSNYCADQLLNRMNGEGVEFIKQILKEY